MKTIDLKELVRQALAVQWPAFVAEHPRLAAAMDEALLLQPALEALSDDPEFREVMDNAAALGTAADAVSDVVTRLVRKWLRQLV